MSSRIPTRRRPDLHSIPHRQRCDRSIRPHEPAPDRPAVNRKSIPQQPSMCIDTRPVCPPIGDDHPTRNGQRVPTPLHGDLPRKPAPPIHLTDELVDIDHVRLQLDDHQRSPAWVPRQDIDDPSLAVDRERDLRRQHPLGQIGGEPARHRFMKGRVTAADESVEIGAARPRGHGHLDIERPSDVENRPEGEPLEVSALDPRDDRSIDPDLRGHILLAPAASDPNRPEANAELLVLIHGGSLIAGTSPARIARSVATHLTLTPRRGPRHQCPAIERVFTADHVDGPCITSLRTWTAAPATWITGRRTWTESLGKATGTKQGKPLHVVVDGTIATLDVVFWS